MTGVPGSDSSRRVQQLDAPAVVAEQRRQPAADAEVDARLRVVGVDPVHVVALLVGHHLERQLVVVAQEERPLAVSGMAGVCSQDVDDREAVLHAQRHEDARHEREVEGHVALVARRRSTATRVLAATGWPRPAASGRRSARRRAARSSLQDMRASRAGSRSWCPRARRGTARRPAAARRRPCRARSRIASRIGAHDRRVVEVEVGLVAEEAVPVVRLGDRVPGPVRGLGVLEDDPRVARSAPGRVAPHVEVALRAARRRAAGALEPRMLVRGVVDHQLGDDPQPARVRLARRRSGSRAACRSRDGRPCSRRCRSRRRAAATGRTAAARWR